MRLIKPILIIITGIIFLTGIFTTYQSKADGLVLNIELKDLTFEAQKQVSCLADNIYHEAGYESEKGKVAVAMVTMNRTQIDKFGNTICGVVKQKINSTCQFSWVCVPVKDRRESTAYQEALRVALNVYANYENMIDVTKGALYYHADYVNPGWKLSRTVKIGRHIFYKGSENLNDAKNKSTAERRSDEPFILSNDGGNHLSYMQDRN